MNRKLGRLLEPGFDLFFVVMLAFAFAALVAGEGQHPDNFTTVRVFNNQQTCITQFLAFDASVTGGVQVRGRGRLCLPG